MSATVPTSRTTAPDLRASDADRDRVAEALAAALSEGRLTQDEHADRLEATYAAKTLGELAPLTDDLPDTGNGAAAGPDTFSPGSSDPLFASATGSENITAVFGTAERSGRWLVEPRTNVSLLCGHSSLDLRQAVLAKREVTIQCAPILSNLELILPPGIRVVNRISTIAGCVDESKVRSAPSSSAPTVVLTGICLLSSIEVKTRGLPTADADRRE
ncbi:MAG: DUF1707 domain-containing protein [Nocardiopsaceae bacterium]|nr:DUF1707 domain-containing protein [Nocardiopsaceae bacterium]